MDLQLKDLHVLITGGSRGIGFACAELFLREGARVTIVGRTPSRVEDAVKRLGPVAGHVADLTDAAASAAMVDAVLRDQGAVDILVNSAGAAQRTPFAELTPQAWRAAMDAKFFSYIHVIDPIVKTMGERGRGAIVNVIGMGGKVASPTHLAGGSANAALMLATVGLANAWGPKGVRVNAVNPATTMTDRMAEGVAADARLRGVDADEIVKQLTARAPLGRLATPEDIADAVVYLASPRAAYINGAIVSMDGAAVPIVA